MDEGGPTRDYWGRGFLRRRRDKERDDEKERNNERFGGKRGEQEREEGGEGEQCAQREAAACADQTLLEPATHRGEKGEALHCRYTVVTNLMGNLPN